jgi:Cdc6-like AAA superfamily ATPase
MQLESPLHVYT